MYTDIHYIYIYIHINKYILYENRYEEAVSSYEEAQLLEPDNTYFYREICTRIYIYIYILINTYYMKTDMKKQFPLMKKLNFWSLIIKAPEHL
jgi:hypothetical protein